MEEKKKKKFRLPILVKTIIIIIVFGAVLVETAMVFFSLTSSNSNKKAYKQAATELAETVALSIDTTKVKKVTDDVIDIYNKSETKPGRESEGTPEYEEYMAQFEAIKKEDYLYLQNYLHNIKLANTDTDGIYLGYVDYANKKTIYIVYDQENEWFPTGIIDDLYEEDYPIIEDHHLGFVASIYTDEATKEVLVTAGSPVINPLALPGEEDVICYALVDISMAAVRKNQANSIVSLFFYLMLTVFGLSIIGVIIIHFIFTKPIKTLQNAALSYDLSNPDKTHEQFTNLKVHVHDELDDLAQSMKKMESDVNQKIKELTASQQYAEKMTELANKDALTGVRNKVAYDSFVKEIDEKIKNKETLRFGVAMVDLNYLKNINDEYGHDSGDIALIKLATIICGIFAHSPVFRIGGDEFVILLRNKDYGNAKALLDEFNHKIDDLAADCDLLPEEQVSAAIGYSKYNDKKDTCVDDVFKRADKEMYIRKRQMKKS